MEICGKNHMYERPVLILRKYGKLFVCLPLTSKIPKYSQFYYELSYENDCLKSTIHSYVILSSPMTYDVLRLSRKIRRLHDTTFNAIKQRSQGIVYKNDPPKKVVSGAKIAISDKIL
jgi:mRNA-degrading endonuclease toxin of MazEF toxin-antitoxin module